MAGDPPHARRGEFEQVALPHLKSLFNLAFKLTRDRKDAEDLVQETYLRAYRFFDTYEPDTQIKAWLFRILRNTYINRYRAARVRPEEVELSRIEAGYEGMVDEAFLREREPRSPEDVLLDSTLDGEVEKAMAALPEDYRAVVIMALVEEMSYKEIAAALSIPLGTVMSRLHRGRRLLQGALLEYAARRGILRGSASVSKEGEGVP